MSATPPTKIQTCSFQKLGGKTCARAVMGPDQYCSLHYGFDRKPTEDIPENAHFEADFRSVVHANDGDWRGFVFPAGIQLPEEISFAVDARGSRLALFVQEKVTFKAPVDFSDAIFKDGLTLKGVVFEDKVTFDGCRFEGPVDILNVQCNQVASFYRADFAGRTVLRANFRKRANFNEAIFRDGVNFTGWRNVSVRLSTAGRAMCSVGALTTGGRKPTLWERLGTWALQARNRISREATHLRQMMGESVERIQSRLNTLRRSYARSDPNTQIIEMFEDEGQFEGVVFLKPDQTLFSQVDLSKVYFRGTNLRGVRFLGVTWWQPIFRRNGLYDEVFIMRSNDGPFKHFLLPVLEETCRNARVAYEENRSFGIASDFYVAEMEAARAQRNFFGREFFSVPALYRAVSKYGTSVGTALRVLALIYILHMVTTLALGSPSDTVSMASILETALRSFRVLLSQPIETKSVTPSSAQSWLDLVFRILGLIQVAMVVLAFRSRIKRH